MDFKNRGLLTLLALAAAAALMAAGCELSDLTGVSGLADDRAIGQAVEQNSDDASQAAIVAATSLSDQEVADLEYLREEEKLARDVYMALYAQWGAQTFANIILSEQKHTDAVAGLLVKYGIPDPAAATVVGEFTDPGLQELHDELVAAGSISLGAALEVGIHIEVIDLEDIAVKMKHTTRRDILRVYGNLYEGSENHLAASTSAYQTLIGPLP